MTLSVPRVRHYLKNGELEKLFIEELGWDRHSASFDVQVDGHTYALRAFAEKRGVQIFTCQPDGDGKIPDYTTRRKIEKQVTKSAYEHLIIFVDNDRTTQIWQWVARHPGQPAAYREHPFYPQHQSGDALIQKLNAITIPLDEEEALDLTGTIHKLRDAFDRDRVTKRFYDHFQREHTAFLKFITGITEQGDKEWYASLMLNRLMFVYFIQKKGFLDGNEHYLRERLQTVQQRKGKGKFHTFYSYFLLALFHEGFAKQPKDRKLDADLLELLGEVPYLNGGLFEVHQLEENYPKIDIPDEAFENLFTFFDQYDWTLDTRPLRNDREINPDVLGYIFEKYINQKEMGAYYTKEDITEYISKNTILPHLFDAAEKKCAVAFQSNSALWRLLRDDPDRYIYPAVRQGVIDEHGEAIPESTLPEFVQKGMHDPKARMFNKQYNLGQASVLDGNGNNLALPTETWREYVTRRQRCLELREKLQSGVIHQINDLITYNLHIRQFAEDVIDTCEGPELLRAFYQAISSITVLDPTCGSGAFLFAALNILEPLYEACLERMQAFVEDLERSGERHSPKKFEDFRKVLAEIERHPNRAYFILKSIIVNNLYGVDIMEEAVEICKLRLFLKLVAQVDKAKDLEPLPDIDFNIRAGNTLVGFVSLEEIRRAAERETSGQGRLVFGETEKAIRRIEEDAEIVERAFQKFHEMQTEHGMEAREFVAQKQELRLRLKRLAEELDRYLAREYSVSVGANGHSPAFEKWRKTHQPFHWFAEFYGIMHQGGFDVIIGNPPYVEMKDVRDYEVHGYATVDCRNLYPLCVERSSALLALNGSFGMIVPLSGFSTSRMKPYQDHVRDRYGQLYISYYSGDAHPSVMFTGVKYRLSIIIGRATQGKRSQTQVTDYLRWYAEERPFLFPKLFYTECQFSDGFLRFAKLGSVYAKEVLGKMLSGRHTLGSYLLGKGAAQINYHRSPVFWIRSMDFEPYFKSATKQRSTEHLRDLYLSSKPQARRVGAILNSTCFYLWFTTQGNCRNLAGPDIDSFPVGDLDAPALVAIESQFSELMEDLRKNSKRRVYNYERSGRVEYEEFYPDKSKPTINKIDCTLAKHYSFIDEELDFIINYDIKYRMGLEVGEDEAG
jgi:hypothetical protein